MPKRQRRNEGWGAGGGRLHYVTFSKDEGGARSILEIERKRLFNGETNVEID